MRAQVAFKKRIANVCGLLDLLESRLTEACLLGALWVTSTKAQTERPNIIYLLTDDQRADFNRGFPGLSRFFEGDVKLKQGRHLTAKMGDQALLVANGHPMMFRSVCLWSSMTKVRRVSAWFASRGNGPVD